MTNEERIHKALNDLAALTLADYCSRSGVRYDAEAVRQGLPRGTIEALALRRDLPITAGAIADAVHVVHHTTDRGPDE